MIRRPVRPPAAAAPASTVPSAAASAAALKYAAARRAAGRNAVEGVNVAVVICAAGSSSRMAGGGLKKEYRAMPGSGGRLTVLGATVRAFAVLPEVQTIVIAVPDDTLTGEAAARRAIPRLFLEGREPALHFVKGGRTRRVSVFNALSILAQKFGEKPGRRSYVLIHDGARPWINPSFVRRIIAEVKKHPAVIPILPLAETPKETTLPINGQFGAGATVYVKNHLKRPFVGSSQTPQAFAFPEILELHKMADEHERVTGTEFTDDAEIWGIFHGSVAVIPGDPRNRKITFPEDLG